MIIMEWENLLSRCYYARYPVFGENGVLTPGKYTYTITLLADPTSKEMKGADVAQAILLMTQPVDRAFCNTWSHGHFPENKPTEAEVERLTEETIEENPDVGISVAGFMENISLHHPEIGDISGHLAQLFPQAQELNPPDYVVFTFDDSQVSRFENMGLHKKCAAIIQPTSQQMYEYYARLASEYIVAQQEWDLRFDGREYVALDEYHDEVPKNSEDDRFILQFWFENEDEKIAAGLDGEESDDYMRFLPLHEVANEIAESNSMLEMIRNFARGLDIPFSAESPGKPNSIT